MKGGGLSDLDAFLTHARPFGLLELSKHSDGPLDSVCSTTAAGHYDLDDLS